MYPRWRGPGTADFRHRSDSWLLGHYRYFLRVGWCDSRASRSSHTKCRRADNRLATVFKWAIDNNLATLSAVGPQNNLFFDGIMMQAGVASSLPRLLQEGDMGVWNVSSCSVLCAEQLFQRRNDTAFRHITPPLVSYNKAEPPAISLLEFAVYPCQPTIMSSDLQSTLELLQINDYVSRMVVHTSDQWLILYILSQSWLPLLSYMIMVSSAFVQFISETEMRNGNLPLCWQSSRFRERYVINLFYSPHLIWWLTMLKDGVCLGEEAKIIRQGPSPSWSLSHSTDPGPGSPQCSFWCV